MLTYSAALCWARAGSSPPDQATSFLAAGSDYYFYQAADGQWLFLASLDARILLGHYGSYGALPRSVTGRLLEVDAVTQTEAARKKMKFLGHLPLSGGGASLLCGTCACTYYE